MSPRSYCILSNLHLILKKQKQTNNKQTNATWSYFFFFCTIFCASGPCITCGCDMTKFSQCQFETCLKKTKNKKKIKIKNTFFRRAHHANLKHVSGWRMFQNSTQHVHSFNNDKKHLLLSTKNNSTLY